MMVERLDGYDRAELLGGGMSRVYRATRRRDGCVVAVKSVALASEDVARAERRGAELQKQFHAIEPRVPDVCDIRDDGRAAADRDGVHRRRGSLDRHPLARPACRRPTPSGSPRASPTCSIAPTSSRRSSTARPTAASSTAISSRATSGSSTATTRLDRRIRVLDFGVAKGIRGGGDGETRNVFGSAPYMAPERLIDGTVSPATDCWSLGVVLCEMLTGRVPFSGSERDVLAQIDRGMPALPPDCPPDLCAIVERLLARQPRARYRDRRRDSRATSRAGSMPRARPPRCRAEPLVAAADPRCDAAGATGRCDAGARPRRGEVAGEATGAGRSCWRRRCSSG